MRTTRLFILALFISSTWALAAEPQALTQQEQNKVQELAGEMSSQGIPQGQAESMLRLMYQNRYQEQNIIQAQQTVQEAAEEDLPTEPLMNKAMEGMAKQVPEDQVIAAMETVRNRYRYAYRLARTVSDEKKANGPVTKAIADCLAAGMSDEEMDTIMTRLQTRTRLQTKDQAEELAVQTMLTVRTMMRLGANAADTTNTVCQRLQQHYSAQQMAQLRHRFSEETENTPARQLARQYAGSSGPGAGSGGNNSGGNGSGGNGSGGNGSGGGSGSGGSGSGGNGSGGNGSGGGGGNGGGGRR